MSTKHYRGWIHDSLQYFRRLDSHRCAAAVAAVAAAWMAMLSTRYTALALADVRGGVGAGFDDGSWITTAYPTGEVIGIVAGCWLAAAISLKRILIGAATVFTISSLLPLLTPHWTTVVAVRLIQGLAGGALLPMAIVGLLRSLPPAYRALAIALYTSASTLAPQLAGALTGWLLNTGDWQLLFWANIPLGLMAICAAAYGFPREAVRLRPLLGIDRFRLLLLVSSLALLSCAFDQGNRLDWLNSGLIRGLLFAGGAALCAYLIYLVRLRKNYLLGAGLILRRNVTLGALGVVPFGIAGLGCAYVIPEYLVQAHLYRPDNIAPILWDAAWPQILAYGVGIISLSKRWIPPRTLLAAGFVFVAAGLIRDSLGLYGVWIEPDLRSGQILQGFGLPLILLPLLFLFVSDLVPQEGLQAALLFNVLRSLGGTVGLATIETLDRFREQIRSNVLVEHIVIGAQTTVQHLDLLTSIVSGRSIGDAQATARATTLLSEAVQNQAQILGHADTLAALGATMLIAALFAFSMAPAGSGHPVERQSIPNK
jgi:MFS transporter, DHA2 family, multidrug resistance protein